MGDPREGSALKPGSLYDAVAGRLGYKGFLTDQQPSKYRDTPHTSTVPVRPEEVLFRSKYAPVRYEEDDIYDADRHLQLHQKLPDSDFLKTIHTYTADFYDRAVSGDMSSFQSLDETALIAMGILLEEAASAGLGKSGDLAFVETAEIDQASVSRNKCFWHEGRWRRSVIEDGKMPRKKHFVDQS